MRDVEAMLDTLAYVLGLVGAWTIASSALHDVGGPDGMPDLRRRRLHESVRRLPAAPTP
ncbi:hypothetical protein ACH492_10535 [Streptomyces sp. NPDC019443]|uniref:hypothetical protein n=1 Tax=Streptomyces sp. NPDC019443 TaxID=3365061 RepID=UPI0037A7C81D